MSTSATRKNLPIPTTVDFNGDLLTCLKVSESIFVAMKSIAEKLGLEWTHQLRQIKTDPVLGSTMAEYAIVASDGKNRKMVFLPLDYLNGWLFKIDAARYKSDDPRREVIIRYQRECYRVLHDYWHKGSAVKDAGPRTVGPYRPTKTQLSPVRIRSSLPSVREEPWAWHVGDKPVARITEVKAEVLGRLGLISVEHASFMLGVSFPEILPLLDPEALHYVVNDSGSPLPHGLFPCPHHGDLARWWAPARSSEIYITNRGMRELFGKSMSAVQQRLLAMASLCSTLTHRERKSLFHSLDEFLKKEVMPMA